MGAKDLKGKDMSKNNSLAVCNTLVAVYNTHSDAAAGVSELREAGFEIAKISIVGKIDEQNHKYPTNSYPSMVLAGSISMEVNSLGRTLCAGPLAAIMTMDRDGTDTLDVDALAEGLDTFGVPHFATVRHKANLRADKVLLLAEGAAGELIRAKDILHNTRCPEEMDLHFGVELATSHA